MLWGIMTSCATSASVHDMLCRPFKVPSPTYKKRQEADGQVTS
jgi:hypothetical protein